MSDDDAPSGGLSFTLVLQLLGVSVIAILLSLLGAAAGWIAGGGVFSKGFNYFTLIGGCSGFILGTLLGYFTIGPGKSQVWKMVKKNMPPDAQRIKLGLGNTKFSIDMSIHEVRNVIGSDGIWSYFGKKTDSYVEVRVGRKLGERDNFTVNPQNPVKRTCIEEKGKFEETFKLTIRPTDDTIEIKLMDQDVAGDDTVGFTFLHISKDIVGEGFPQHKGFKLMQKDSILWGGTLRRTGVIIVSFSPGENMPQDLVDQLQQQYPMEFERYKRRFSNVSDAEKLGLINNPNGSIPMGQPPSYGTNEILVNA